MWKKISLRVRVYIILTTLIFITLTGGLVMVWYTYRIEGLFTYIIDKNIAAFQVAEALETALVNQKGFVTYFFMDGDPDWLRQLGEYRQLFKNKIKDASNLVETEKQKKSLNLLEKEYERYIELKDQVISLYKSGNREEGLKIHEEARSHFFRTLELCERFRDIYAGRISQVKSESLAQAVNLRIIAVSAIITVLCLGIVLVFVLVKHILEPIRLLAMEADRENFSADSENEVKALSRSVRGLIENFDQTHLELERSRETLVQAEKLAMVGKLAAGVAHSIRNPLTSVKMRLFSMGRALEMPLSQKEDFNVISEEINHIDTIVQNFLEFSRPPKLRKQMISPSDIVDLVIQMLKHRLESSNVNVISHRKESLPKVEIDPEQIKEVLVNLIVNACEAMDKGGTLEIFEEQKFVKNMGDSLIIRLKDNGPGMPISIQDKILQPFYTTKEEGTGLGLSIAERIVANHGGTITFESIKGSGTTFIITLPLEVIKK